MANLGQLFGLAILSTSEETLTHQLGRKPLGKLRMCCLCFAVLFLIVEYPTPWVPYFLLSVISSFKLLVLVFSSLIFLLLS